MEWEDCRSSVIQDGSIFINHVNALKRYLVDQTSMNDIKLYETIVSQLYECSSQSINKEVLRSYFKEILYILKICSLRVANQESCFHLHVDILSILLNFCRRLIKSECMIKQSLPIICTITSVDDPKLFLYTANYIRLAIRYHPKTGSELALNPLLTAAANRPSHELMKILFYIHSYNAVAFWSPGIGQQLLSIYSQKSVPVPVQLDCLILIGRILDDIPRTDTTLETCFGMTPSDAVPILLKAGNTEVGAILTSVFVKFVQRDLYASFAAHANSRLSSRLCLSWPGALEAAVTLLRSLVKECSATNHKHQKNATCIPGCIAAVIGYLRKAETAKQVLTCLVTLQDFSRHVSPKVLEVYEEAIGTACFRVGIDQTMFWDYLDSHEFQKAHPGLGNPVRMNAVDTNKTINDQRFPPNISKENESSSPENFHSSYIRNTHISELYSNSSQSYSTTDCGEPNTHRVFSASMKVVCNGKQLSRSHFDRPKKWPIETRVHSEENSVAESTLNNVNSSSTSSRTSTTTGASYSPGEDRRSSSSLSFGEVDPDAIEKANSVRFPTLPGFSSPRNTPGYSDTQGVPTQLRFDGQQFENSVSKSGVSDPVHLSLTKSAPQLSPVGQLDSVQRFYERYYAKLVSYVDFVSNRFPLPAALGLEDFKTRSLEAESHQLVLWLNERSTRLEGSQESSNDFQGTARSLCPSLTLYFACCCRRSQCLFPGNRMDTCFRVITENPVTWMQIIILGTQVKYGKALPSEHLAMRNLRWFWAQIVDPSACSSRQRSILRVHSDSARYSNTQYTVPGISPSTVAREQAEYDGARPKSPLLNRIRTWNSMRTRSRKQLSKFNSFFLLATRSFPNSKECETIVKELKEARFFELFEPVTDPKNATEKVSQNYANRWCCFLCNQSPRRCVSGSRSENTTVCATKPQNSRIMHPPPNSIQLETWCPEMTAQLYLRHARRIPVAMVWISRWQKHEVILKDGILGWRRRGERGLSKDEQSASNKRPDSTSKSSRINRNSEHLVGDDLQRAPPASECIHKNQWTCIFVGTIVKIESIRNKKTDQLLQLQLTIRNNGVLFLKSLPQLRLKQPAVSSAIPRVPNEVEELTEWSRALQVAMIRAHQKLNI
ncbi:hypothetical protein X801_04680 [Opisthorchis viverrini]|uniref:Uncharacterized protein n=1 Tax=Opisthorchis viverrini TaxID=6198 RepID=A0A1S8WY62_OPIVI|nr:hypothetical protein X801_04680 [Opisthorchis viverrini]